MKQKSIYKYAAEAGMPVGIYLSAMSACLLLSNKIPFLPTLLLPLAIGFPFVLWMTMKKIGQEQPSYQKFSTLWLGGIYTVIFGTLICMLFSGVYITFFEPGFVHNYVTNAIMTVEESSMAEDYQSTLILMRDAIEAKILPTGMQFITTMAWFTCFTGSILSLVISLLITKTGKKTYPGIGAANN